MNPLLRPVAARREDLAALEEERAEKIAARNSRMMSLYASGVPTARIAEAASMTPASVRKISGQQGVARGDARAVTEADEVNLEWLRRLLLAVDKLDAQIAAAHDARNAAILAASADGVPHQTIANAAGIGRARVSRLVSEA